MSGSVNKPITIVCGTMAVTGLWILGAFLYYGMVYGDGNFEAGNYHRNRYWGDTNLLTGAITKHWERRWELTESTERPSGLGYVLYDTEAWIFSVILLLLSAGIWVGEWATRRE